jgi:hypothetical protein
VLRKKKFSLPRNLKRKKEKVWGGGCDVKEGQKRGKSMTFTTQPSFWAIHASSLATSEISPVSKISVNLE